MVVIDLPWPSPKLHAHAKGTWRVKAKATKDARLLAGYVAKQEGVKIAGRATVEYVFYVGDKRKRDEVNMMQACKAYLDGCIDAGVVEGDDWMTLHTQGVRVFLRPGQPGVRLVFRAEKDILKKEDFSA